MSKFSFSNSHVASKFRIVFYPGFKCLVKGNMTTISNSNQRISSLDLVKGLAMLIMALDHVRDFVHAPAFV